MEIQRTVSKVYGTDKVGDWNLNYEYESENNEVPKQVIVNGTNGAGGFMNYTKAGLNSNVSFSGGSDVDSDVINAIKSSIEEINSSFANKKGK